MQKRIITLLSIAGLAIAPLAAQAQEDYEYEPDEGVHEEEWYDPSDWFDDWGYDEGTVDYETDYWDWGWYDEPYEAYYYEGGPYGYNDYYDEYDYGWHYESLENDWEYGWHYDTFGDYDTYDYDYEYDYADRDVDYTWNQTVRGEVAGVKRIRGAAYGEPDRLVLRVRTEDGETREVTLGDVGYASDYMQGLENGDRIAIGGRVVEMDGRQIFKANEVRTPDSNFGIPEYEYQRTIRGELKGVRRVKTRAGDVEAVVAKIRDPRGETREVLLGQVDDLRGIGKSIRPDARVRIDGYERIVDGESTFVVTNVRILERPQQQGDQQQRTDQQRRRQMEPQRVREQQKEQEERREAQRRRQEQLQEDRRQQQDNR
jgi:hypothetical protein